MSIIKNVRKKCAICGKVSNYTIILSSNCFGHMDLDTRPSQMLRSLLPYQIEFCEKCGYANDQIEELAFEDVKLTMKNEEYQNILNNDFIPNMGKAYLLSGYLHEINKEDKKSGFLYMMAAWSFDDCLNKKQAIYARKKAISLFEKYLKKEDNIQLRMIIVDLLRRTEKYEEAILSAQELLNKVEEEFLKKILLYQIDLSKINESSCHNVGEVK